MMIEYDIFACPHNANWPICRFGSFMARNRNYKWRSDMAFEFGLHSKSVRVVGIGIFASTST